MQEPDAQVHLALSRADVEAAPIPESERALLRFAAKVTQHAYKVVDEDVEGLRQHAWPDEAIAECVYITAMFAFFNRVADAFGLEDPRYFDNPPARGGDPGGDG